MAATTPTLWLYKPGGGSSGLITPDETVDIDKLNANADLIDAEALSVRTRLAPLEDQNRQYRGPAASLAGLSGMRLGDTYQETDAGKRLWYYDGTNWVTNEGGLFLIRPTGTVTNGTVDPLTGAVSFSAKTSISIDTLFTDKYIEYLVVVELDSATATGDVSMTFRTGGAAAGGTYSSSGIEVSIGAGPTRRESNTVANLGRISTGGAFMELRLHNLMEAKNKRAVFSSFDNDNFHRTGGANHISTALCDGITLAFTSSSTGSLKVYGYR